VIPESETDPDYSSRRGISSPNMYQYSHGQNFENISTYTYFSSILDDYIKGTGGHLCRLLKTRRTRDIAKYFFSNKVISRRNLLDQRTVDAPSINAFKSRLIRIRDSGWASSWTSPLSTRPYWLGDLLVRLHKVNHKVNHFK